MFRTFAVTTVAAMLAGAGVLAAHADSGKYDELVFASSLLSFDKGVIDSCNYGKESLSGIFMSDKGHTLSVMFENKKGTINVTGASKNTGVIGEGRVDDRGSFVFTGIISDGVGKSADFTFSGLCHRPKPAPKPTPKPTGQFNLTSATGKYDFSGTKINRCIFGKNVLHGEFVGTKGDVLDVKVSVGNETGQGEVNLKTAKGEKVAGLANESRVNDAGEFSISGTFKVGLGENFVFTGKCPKK